MLRLGSVPYLNARPLIEGLAAEPGLTLREAVPAALAAALRAGELDAALASSVELFREPPPSWVPGPAITSAGPVRSILLFLRTEPGAVATLALDSSSRSAAVLARVCLAEFLGARVECVVECAPDAPLASIDADAILRIGDPALATARAMPPNGRAALDLGELWTEATGLPFVYALWLARPGVAAEPLGGLVRAARERGLDRLDALAARHGAAVLGGDARGRAAARDYLRESIGFDCGPRERQGLELFGRLAHRHGLVDRAELPEPLR